MAGQSLPLWGRWHGEAVTEEGSTHSPKEMQLGGGYCNLFSQKSKIFASFPKGEALGAAAPLR